MPQKIEVGVKNYFAGIECDGYSGNFRDRRIINIRLSRGVKTDPKPDRMTVTLERE